MDERMRFVIRLKDGEAMASLCREFGISRKTGYKIFERYEQCGLEGLSDRTRRPFRYANQLPEQVEAAIVSRSSAHAGARGSSSSSSNSPVIRRCSDSLIVSRSCSGVPRRA